MAEAAHLLFVYGTLRQVGGKEQNFGPGGGAEVVVPEAYLEGFQLLDLGHFPGIVAGDGKVRGEVHQLESPGEYDRYEGYYPENPENSLYVRRQVTVSVPDQEDVAEVWVYLFNRGKRERAAVIESGDWFQAKDLYELEDEDQDAGDVGRNAAV